MDIYKEWGFHQSPFSTTSLQADERGDRLLIGREKELTSLQRKIYSPPKIPTVEGLNGVGKTSLVNVAAFRSYRRYHDESDPLYIPCRKVFQIKPDQSADDFIIEVLMEVAQTMIEHTASIRTKVKTKSLDAWLNSPLVRSFGAGAVGFQLVGNTEANTSQGYLSSGLRKEVTSWLEDLFPKSADGGIICIIDNLELLQSSEKAKNVLEQLRDELLTLPGLRWILCGALGIVLGVVASPRLDGYLHRPIEVSGISEDIASEILSSRIEAYKEIDAPYLPLTTDAFVTLYEILRGNLRSVISYADDFCQWIADEACPSTVDEKDQYFSKWLNELTHQAQTAFNAQTRPKAREVFVKAAQDYSGLFSPSDFLDFGFNSIPAFRPHIRDLEATGVLVSTQDDGDKRRKTIQVTPKGWMILHCIRQGS